MAAVREIVEQIWQTGLSGRAGGAGRFSGPGAFFILAGLPLSPSDPPTA